MLTAISLAACSPSSNSGSKNSGEKSTTESSNKPTLEIPVSVVADGSKTAAITGKTTPNTKVQIGYGIIGDKVTSDKEGNFTLKYEIDEANDQDTIEVTAKNDGGKTTKEITIKQNPEVIKKKEADAKAKADAEAKAKADEEAKAKAAADAKAKEEADKTNPATYPTSTYDEMARNGNSHAGEKLQITGKVIQAQDTDSGGAMLRVATGADGYDDIYMVQIDSDNWNKHRLLEDDQITIYGNVYGLYSYTSTLGGKITVPALIAVFY
ncbi:hypothetical protein [Lactococcus lactis]|nr:hypothetical protein [Lactococcus lactis]